MVNSNPLTAPLPKEIPLDESPLIRVIAQVRFSTILSIEKKDYVAPFQEAIREKYPILKSEQIQAWALDPQGTIENPSSQVTWRFMDLSENWRVSLSSNFVALETTAYSSRRDFLERLENILSALEKNIEPPQITERFGLRYIDQLVGQDLQNISSLVKTEVLGIMTDEFRKNIYQSLNETLFVVPEGEEQILARWGLLPANTMIDPSLEPISEPSWILDLDMSLLKNREFSIEALMSEGQRFAERIYTFFRWAVKDDFLKRFGGQL